MKGDHKEMNTEQMDNLMDDLRLFIEELEAKSWSSDSFRKAIAALEVLINNHRLQNDRCHHSMQ